MLIWDNVKEDKNARKIHEHGFVVLKEVMGSDSTICESARVSYGNGTKTISDDRNLIRYLVRHRHTSPLEQASVRFLIKLPIFVMRQLVRHRTAKLNEYSARYSILSDEFYIPDSNHLGKQSASNKQGTEEFFSNDEYDSLVNIYHNSFDHSFESYGELLDSGVSRELSRCVMPVSNYTICYWKNDLHNFLHCAKLRLDPHAQREVVDFASAMYELVKPCFPLACEAFEDYQLNARNLSALELKSLKYFLDQEKIKSFDFDKFVDGGFSKRELKEFKEFLLNYM